MHLLSELPPDESQPRKACVRRLRYGSRYVKMKDRFRSSTYVDNPTPSRVSGARSALTEHAIANELNVSVIAISWPVLLKIIEEGVPPPLNLVDVEIPQRKRKSMVDADYRRVRAA